MDGSRNCLLEARREYTTLLCYKLYKPIYQGIRHYWELSKKSAKPGSVYEEFQKKLRMVKNWNQDVIENEYKRVLEKSKCDYLEDLIRKVFILNTQILASVEAVHPNQKIKVPVPKGEKFLHRCYTECARMFYESVWLLEDRPDMVTRLDQAKHLQKAYKLIMTCIENTIRNMLPIESLMRQPLQGEDGDDVSPPMHMAYGPMGFGQPGFSHVTVPAGVQPQWPPVSAHGEGSASDQAAAIHLSTLSRNALLGPQQEALPKDYSLIKGLYQGEALGEDGPAEEPVERAPIKSLFEDSSLSVHDGRGVDGERPQDSEEDRQDEKDEKGRDEEQSYFGGGLFSEPLPELPEEPRTEETQETPRADEDSFAAPEKEQTAGPMAEQLKKIIYLNDRDRSYRPRRSRSPTSDTEEALIPNDEESRDTGRREGPLEPVEAPVIEHKEIAGLDLEVVPTDIADFDLDRISERHDSYSDSRRGSGGREERKSGLGGMVDDLQNFFDDLGH